MWEQRDGRGSVMGAFVIGAAAGAAVALLFAPASGDVTRRKIASKAREGRQKAEAIARDARQRAEAVARGSREFIQRQRETFGAAVESGRDAYEQVRKGTV